VTGGARPARLPSSAAALCAELAALGPYFSVETHDPLTGVQEPWQPLSALLGSPDALAAWIAGVRASLAATAGVPPGSVDFRVAVSVAQLGMAARLLSPAFGAAVLGAMLPIEIAAARWVPATGSLFRLSLPDTALAAGRFPTAPDAGTVAGVLARSLLDGSIGALVDTCAAMSVSRKVLWGNVASAINGATVMITAARPGLGNEAAKIASALLHAPGLAGGHVGAPGAGFRRRSCCLIYRLAAGPARPVCGDCVLSGRGSSLAAARPRRNAPPRTAPAAAPP
jgi:hypothetical protein